ncbi:sulfhydryl oxidase 2-like [Drosophila gunungcola]|uniref:Sulfhydryl oxidase n=1 Tax=Drosophila gunungcola TaxID=103775 RepID=A0A9Q0BWX6_9MUSC|nr:sulfhydryl oxidase 2-like [Drosophila gunungcola]KAI8046699.1 hypothetical protein M5D96_002912 [Drosophila gunungcola]
MKPLLKSPTKATSLGLWMLLFCAQLLFCNVALGQVKKQVFRADLIKGLDTFMHTVIPNATLMEGDKLMALDEFFRALKKLNPLNNNGDLLVRYAWPPVLPPKPLTGKQFSEKLKSLELKYQEVFTAKDYVGCASNSSSSRGYPCALWTLFHYWTVQNGLPSYPLFPGNVLRTIWNFVKYFYDCPDCVSNFEKMVKRRPIELVKTHDAEILWLWETHNEFNKLTATQFPSANMCPTCRNKDQSWRNDEVLKYLKSLYAEANFSFDGLSTSKGYKIKSL